LAARYRASDPLRGLISEVLSDSKSQTPEVAPDGAEKYFSAVSRLDYRSTILSQFGRRELCRAFSEFRHLLPTLNRSVFCETDLDGLAKIASSFGIVLQRSTFEGPEGDTLRGFYINDRTMIKEPIICLNSAHHRVSRAAAFWHEMGHHLTHEIFGGPTGRLNLTYTSGDHKRLTDPQEILADVVLALAGYPKAIAERMFRSAKGENSKSEVVLLVPKVRSYLDSITEFDWQRTASQYERLNVLARMIHIAKLRATLLNEYGI
jgi:hypothetical protein